MTRRHRWLSAGAFVVALAAVAWFASHRASAPIEPLRSASAPPAAASGVAAAAAPQTAAVVQPTASRPDMGPQHELPDFRVPLDEAVPLLVEYAKAGDVMAGLELSSRLGVCTEYAQRAARESDERDREIIEKDQHDERFTDEERAPRIAFVQSRIDTNARNLHDCERLPADLLAHRLDGVDRAAQAGNIWAKLEYAGFALADYDSVAAIVANPEEAIARREKARAYLMEVLQSGDPRSLRELAEGYAPGSISTRLFAPDASKAYAYAYAAMLAGVFRPEQLDWIVPNSAEQLSAAQRAAAEASGRSIYERCCVKH